MAKIDRFGIKQPDGTFQYHDIGAKAENVIVDNENLSDVIKNINTEIDAKFNSSGGEITGELTPAGGIKYNGKTGYISFPDNNRLKTLTNTVGQLKIYLPNFWCDTFIKFKISIANSDKDSSVEYIVAGYMDSVQQTWTQCTAFSLGKYNERLANLNVGFGISNSVCAISLGNIGTSWNYVTITISDITINNLLGEDDYLKWAQGWSILINANEDMLIKQTISNPHIAEDVKTLALNATSEALNAAKLYADQKIADLIDNAPETLDTLKEIANEIGDNQSAIDAMNTLITTKADKNDLAAHVSDTIVHVTNAERTKWNAKQDLLTIDEQISSSSVNPVQNKVIYNALENKVNKVIGKDLSTNDFTNKDKTKLENIEENANNYIHPNSGVTPGTYSKVTVNAQGHVTVGSNPTITISEGGTGATTAEIALENLGLTATAKEINILDGATVTTTELNYVDGVTSNIQTQLDHKASLDTATSDKNGLLSANDKAKLDTIEEGANKYIPPTYTSYTSGLYNITVNGLGHVSSAKPTIKSDITSLGIPGQDTTYENATQSNAGLMSSADKAKLDGIDVQANKYILPVASGTLGGVKTTSTVNSTSGYIATPIIDGVPYYKDTLYTLGSFGVNASADELNKLDGVTVSTAELNALKNVSSNIQTQIDNTKTYVDTTKSNLIGDASTYTTFGKVEDKIEAMVSTETSLQNQVTTNKNNLSSHTGDNVIHITAAERTKWNAAQGNSTGYTDTQISGILGDAETYTTLGKIEDKIVSLDSQDSNLQSQITTNKNNLSSHVSNTTVHITAAERTKWNAAQANAEATAKSYTDTSAASTLASAKSYSDTAISNLINGAPTTLDTLKEIADAMADNQDVVEALEDSIGTKANASDLTAHTGNTTVHITSTERTNWNDANSKKHTHSNKTILDNITASYTTAEQTKLSGIAAGAEVNVQSDWNATSGDAFIKNKPVFLTGGSQTSTSSADGGSNVYTFTKSDGTTSTLTIKNGSKGSTGATGPQGPKGDTGPAGANGTNGTTPTIKAAAGSNIGTVGTPSVTASTSGTTTTFTFNYLKGAKGDKGDKGEPGTAGTNGTNGVTPTIKVASGSNIGSVGTPSVTASTSGTTTTFTFNYLKGAKGDKGDPGVNATTTSVATTSANGLMSAAMVTKLNGIATGANNITKTSQLTNDSGYITGINKTMVTNALGYTPPTSDTNTWRPLGTTADTACAGNDSRLSNSRPASDVYSWAKAASKPSYAASEIATGTFPSAVVAYTNTNYTTNQIRNGVFTTTDPGAGVSTSHANGSIIYVYE